ncbi:hypothetical protein GOBAR_DD35375 [Gossypium barbadense]|nr:hypothetical protein GOBAR_DD35375 [Gossypium barbadense]
MAPAGSSRWCPTIPTTYDVRRDGGIHDEGGKQVTNYTWNIDIPENVDKNKAIMRMYGSDWLMMVDVGLPLSSLPCYSMISRPPLKTLELFPVTASNLKEELLARKGSELSGE